jgi:DNA-binding NarL/FixJ family response regulator
MASLGVISSEPTWTVVVVDDHAIMRDGLIAILDAEPDVEVIGTACDGRSAVEAIRQHRPDVAIMDLSMPGTDGIRAIGEIKRRQPETRVVVLTLHHDERHIHAALAAGADAYVIKDGGRTELLAALRSVADGKQYLSPAVAGTVMAGYLRGREVPEQAVETPSWELLTPREQEVLKLVAEGYKTREIAEYLSLSEKTIEKHRSNMMRKLKLQGVSAVTAYAIENGLLTQ